MAEDNQGDAEAPDVLVANYQLPTGETPLIFIGLSKEARDYLSQERVHGIELHALGIPLTVMIFGGETIEEVKERMRRVAERHGVPLREGARTPAPNAPGSTAKN